MQLGTLESFDMRAGVEKALARVLTMFGEASGPATSAEREINRLKSYGAVALKQYKQARREQRQSIDSLEYNIGTTIDGQTGWEHPLSYAPLYGASTLREPSD
jgi:hypothetical protein